MIALKYECRALKSTRVIGAIFEFGPGNYKKECLSRRLLLRIQSSKLLSNQAPKFKPLEKTLGPTEPGISEIKIYSELPAFYKTFESGGLLRQSSRGFSPLFFLERGQGRGHKHRNCAARSGFECGARSGNQNSTQQELHC